MKQLYRCLLYTSDCVYENTAYPENAIELAVHMMQWNSNGKGYAVVQLFDESKQLWYNKMVIVFDTNINVTADNIMQLIVKQETNN